MTLFHWIGNTLREQLDLIPLSTARWLMIGLFLGLMFWVVQLPTDQTNPSDRTARWTDDLKIWAWLALIIQILIYSLF
ncbi:MULTISPECIES: hypothetical protein [unclassified Schlesneria]|uniref:hypothetical protein n=1 Tax=Schlesneria TaxID=656899 RepID=UPI002F1DDCBB